MIRRLANVIAIGCGVLSLLSLLAIVVSYVRPTTFVVEKVEWDLHETIRQFSTAVGVAGGRLAWFTDPRPVEREVLKQDDWTLTQHDVSPALLPHVIAMPIAGQPRTTRYRGIIGSPSLTSVSLAWPIVVGGALFIASRAFRSRASSLIGVRRTTWRTRLITLGAIASGLSLLVAVVFCVRSFPYFERVDLAVPLIPGPEAIQLNSSRGSLMVAWTRAGPARTLARGGFMYVRSTIPPDRGPLYKAAELKGNYEQALGFTLGNDGGSALPRNVLILPYAFVFVALVPTTFGLARLARRRRDLDQHQSKTHCRRCGYDCRGLADRCPECGTAIRSPLPVGEG